MKKKIYLNRVPIIGDTVEAISSPFQIVDWIIGYEYKVIRLSHGYIVATSERLPLHKKEILIPDKFYKVIEYIEMPEPKEKHVKKYKFFGIPFGTKTTYIYD